MVLDFFLGRAVTTVIFTAARSLRTCGDRLKPGLARRNYLNLAVCLSDCDEEQVAAVLLCSGLLHQSLGLANVCY